MEISHSDDRFGNGITRAWQHGPAPRFLVSADGVVEDTRPTGPLVAPPKYGARLVREKRVRNRIAGGETIYATDGTGYVASHVTWNALTLRLAIPKVRGKAVRKAAKRERQRQMNGALRRQAAVEARAGL